MLICSDLSWLQLIAKTDSGPVTKLSAERLDYPGFFKNPRKMAPNQKRGTFLKIWGSEPALDPCGSVPAVIRRLKLPALPVGSMFAWYYDRLDKQRCQMDAYRRKVADRRARHAACVRRYRAKLRAGRPDLKRKRG